MYKKKFLIISIFVIEQFIKESLIRIESNQESIIGQECKQLIGVDNYS